MIRQASKSDVAEQGSPPRISAAETADIGEKLALVDWQKMSEDLDGLGYAILPNLLTQPQCDLVRDLYDTAELFRSRVVMERYNFGLGEYKYFNYPLPDLVQALRTAIYPKLVPIANRWHEAMHIETRFPETHAEFVARCHAAGQQRPTPLMLRYTAGGYCCLHQDLYGEHIFPLQVVVLLSEPERDFTGGEFMLVEQDTKRTPRAELVPLQQGDAVVFAVNSRPVPSSRGHYRVVMRHGVSRLHDGDRNTLGIIFHDAR
jgi:uncharacterized protein